MNGDARASLTLVPGVSMIEVLSRPEELHGHAEEHDDREDQADDPVANVQGGRVFEEQPAMGETEENRRLKEVVQGERLAEAGETRRADDQHGLLKA